MGVRSIMGNAQPSPTRLKVVLFSFQWESLPMEMIHLNASNRTHWILNTVMFQNVGSHQNITRAHKGRFQTINTSQQWFKVSTNNEGFTHLHVSFLHYIVSWATCIISGMSYKEYSIFPHFKSTTHHCQRYIGLHTQLPSRFTSFTHIRQ